MEQRSFATVSIPGERSRALIAATVGDRDESNLTVLRPVPQPSSVTVIGDEYEERWAKTWVRRAGRSRSSMDCRMLPSVS